MADILKIVIVRIYSEELQILIYLVDRDRLNQTTTRVITPMSRCPIKTGVSKINRVTRILAMMRWRRVQSGYSIVNIITRSERFLLEFDLLLLRVSLLIFHG